MSHSKSPAAKQEAEAPAATAVADEAKPEPSAVAGSKKQAAAKPAKAPAKAKASQPAAEAEQAPAKARAGSESKKHTGKKPKLVRDSFTFPAADYARIAALKQRALKAGHEAKKSELLRAGLAVLSALPDAELLQALNGIDKLKPGRPAR